MFRATTLHLLLIIKAVLSPMRSCSPVSRKCLSCSSADSRLRTCKYRCARHRMEVNEAESNDLERLCQAVSPNDEPCDFPAIVHCAKCGSWFCDAHAEDKEWHSGVLPPG